VLKLLIAQRFFSEAGGIVTIENEFETANYLFDRAMLEFSPDHSLLLNLIEKIYTACSERFPEEKLPFSFPKLNAIFEVLSDLIRGGEDLTSIQFSDLDDLLHSSGEMRYSFQLEGFILDCVVPLKFDSGDKECCEFSFIDTGNPFYFRAFFNKIERDSEIEKRNIILSDIITFNV
jgi:hypothetical protein